MNVESWSQAEVMASLTQSSVKDNYCFNYHLFNLILGVLAESNGIHRRREEVH